MSNPNHGQSWTIEEPWLDEPEYANDLQEHLAGAFGGLFPIQSTGPVALPDEQAIRVLGEQQTKGTLEIRVNDTFAPSRSMVTRVFDRLVWYLDEKTLGASSWSDSSVRPITDFKHTNNLDGLRVSTPWPDLPANERNRLIRAATVSREIGTYAYQSE